MCSHLASILVLCTVYTVAAAVNGPSAAVNVGATRHLDGDIDRPCSLICLNGGSCKLSTDAEVLQLGRPSQYCDCPEGYGGITCEYVAEECGLVRSGEDAADLRDDQGLEPKKKYCMHGSPCKVAVDGETNLEHHYCDCSLAIEAGAYAGESCESPATVYCRGGKVQRASYCVNGGTCREGGDAGESGHAGCDCPSAFEGEYCEYQLGLGPSTLFEAKVHPASNIASDAVGAIMLALLGSVVIGLIVSVFWGARRRAVQDRLDAASAAMNGMSPNSPDSITDLTLDPNGEKLIMNEMGNKVYAPMSEGDKIREEVI